MQVAKKGSIKTRKITVVLLAIFLSIGAYGQYSQPVELTDSLKSIVISQFQTDQNQVRVRGLSVSRYTMPIFCKWELDIQDQTKFPVKFRLGSQEYVDRLEQKSSILNNQK